MKNCCGVKVFLNQTIVGFPDSMKKGGLVYLFTSKIRMRKTANELNILNKIKQTAVFNFTEAASPQLDILWRSWRNPSTYNFDKSNGIAVTLDLGFIQIDKYRLFIESYQDKKYSLSLKSVTGWYYCAERKMLNTIELGGYTFNDANILQTRTLNSMYQDYGQPVQFPMVDYGRVWKDNEVVKFEDYRPFFSPLALLRQGYCECGISFHSPILETEEFRRKWLYILKEDYLAGVTRRREQTFSARIPSNVTIAGNQVSRITVPFTEEYFDGGDVYDTSLPIYSGVGLMKFKMYFVVEITNISVSGLISEFGIRILRHDFAVGGWPFSILHEEFFSFEESLGGATIAVRIETDYLTIGANDFVTLELKMTPNEDFSDPYTCDISFLSDFSFYANEVQRVPYQQNETINLKALIDPDLSLLWLTAAMSHMIDGRIEYDDSTNSLFLRQAEKVEMLDGALPEPHYLDDKIIDLRRLVVCNSGIASFEKSDVKRYRILAFKKSTDEYIKDQIEKAAFRVDDILHGIKLDNGENFEDDTTEDRNPGFEPTAQKIIRIADQEFEFPLMYDNLNGNDSYKIGPRIIHDFGRIEYDGVLYSINLHRITSSYVKAQTSLSLVDSVTSYGDDRRGFYYLYLQNKLRSIAQQMQESFLAVFSNHKFIKEDFRRPYLIKNGDFETAYRLLQIDKTLCNSDKARLTVQPAFNLIPDCGTVTFPDVVCNYIGGPADIGLLTELIVNIDGTAVNILDQDWPMNNETEIDAFIAWLEAWLLANGGGVPGYLFFGGLGANFYLTVVASIHQFVSFTVGGVVYYYVQGNCEEIVEDPETEGCVELCDYQTTWEETMFDITYLLNGIETPMNLASGGYSPSPSGAALLQTDLNAFMAANALPDVVVTWDDSVSPEQLIITGSCVTLVTKEGVNPTAFTELICYPASCSNDLGIDLSIDGSNCLVVTPTGTSSETPLTDVIEYQVDGGGWTTYDELSPPCGCEIMNLLSFEVTCQTNGTGLRIVAQVLESCYILPSTLEGAENASFVFGDASSSGFTDVVTIATPYYTPAQWATRNNEVTVNMSYTTPASVATTSGVITIPGTVDCSGVSPALPATFTNSVNRTVNVRRSVTFPACPPVTITEAL